MLVITDCVTPRVLWFPQTGTAGHAGWPLGAPPVVCRGWQGLCSRLTCVIPSRNKDTTRDEFIFYSKRLMRLLIEHALSFLPLKVSDHSWVRPQPHPYLPSWVPPVTWGLAPPTLAVLPFLQSVTVETPQGTMYEGKRFHRQRVRRDPSSLLPMSAQLLRLAHTRSTQHVSVPFSQITGVSILRAGETMEQALTAVCKDIRLGKILIQTNLDTGEPEVSPAAA